MKEKEVRWGVSSVDIRHCNLLPIMNNLAFGHDFCYLSLSEAQFFNFLLYYLIKFQHNLAQKATIPINGDIPDFQISIPK